MENIDFRSLEEVLGGPAARHPAEEMVMRINAVWDSFVALSDPAANTHRALISLQDVVASYGMWLWTKRNEDKPHRCPRCHGIADRACESRIGPRTVLRCPAGCRLQWRYGPVSRRTRIRHVSTPRVSPWYGW